MIIDFTVGNFLSFKEMQSIPMHKANIKSKFPHVDDQNLIEASKGFTLLKSKAIFGANGSGKSNIIKAMLQYRQIIEHSISNNNILDDIEKFALDPSYQNKPTFFQLTFITNQIPYRYGFEISNGKIINEWLFGTPEKKEVYYFIREENEVKININRFKEGKQIIKGKERLYRDNSLFLSVVAAFNGNIASSILNYIQSIAIVWGLNDKLLTDLATNAMSDDKYRDKIIQLLKDSDMGIENIRLTEMNAANIPKELIEDFSTSQMDGRKLGVIEVEKKVYKDGKPSGFVTFYLHKNEAEGTRKIFSLSPLVFIALERGTPLIIDEFDARLHPILCEKIVQLFNSNETNPNNAQLIFATHNSNLLTPKLFRRDQICFVQKDKFGASQLYSLVEYKKGIRNDASFEKDYLKGKYGAIPILNDFNRIFLNL